jgi:hypothetical protein
VKCAVKEEGKEPKTTKVAHKNGAKWQRKESREQRTEALCERLACEEEIPGWIEEHPSLGAEPTCGQGRDVQQSVAAGAHQLCAAPIEEGSGDDADAGRIGDAAEANGATAPLIGECPAHAE